MRAVHRRTEWAIANTYISLFNCMVMGRQEAAVSVEAPSAAQSRIMDNVLAILRGFLRGCSESAGGENEIHRYLRSVKGEYVPRPHTLALGMRAGVPAAAARVNTAETVARVNVGIARQLENPRDLLLPVCERPEKPPRPFVRTDATYPLWVKGNIQAGLQKLKPRKAIAKHRGRVLTSGVFAVEKDEDEDRCILALCPQNSLMNPKKLWRPRFASLPHMRATYVVPGRQLRVHKIDGRHFFHMLKVGRAWQKWFASPPLPKVGRSAIKYPVHCAVPMGFTGSACWAQLFNEGIISTTSLPAEARLIDGAPPPPSFPIWGSILDDFWGIEEEGQEAAAAWLREVAGAWEKTGIVEHEKKRVEGAVCAEVQGAMVHGKELWIGLSRDKRLRLAEAGWFLMRSRRPPTRSVARWCGKTGYAQFFKPALRCLINDTFTWIDQHRRQDRHRGRLWASVRREIGHASMLLPFAEINLSAPFCPRLEASDASPGGHGRAYTFVDRGLIGEMARLCAGKGVYTSLDLEYGLSLDEAGCCALQQMDFDEKAHEWKEIPRPGGYRHITLEEGSALAWSVASRLTRPSELNTRAVHLIDSAALCGAMRKGRSGSRRLNAHIREISGMTLPAGLEIFAPWVPSLRNPSDAPSSVHGIRAQKPPQPKPKEVVHVSRRDPPIVCSQEHPWLVRMLEQGCARQYRAPSAAASELPLVCIHLCSGEFWEQSICAQVLEIAAELGISVISVAVDPCNGRGADLLDPEAWQALQDLVIARRVWSIGGGPPCSTWSRLRHRPLPGGGGPRPLRARAAPFRCLTGRTKTEMASCNTGTLLMARCIYLFGLAWFMGSHVWMEHPEDPGGDYPSVWASDVVARMRMLGMLIASFDQCQFGGTARKPTTLMTCSEDLFSAMNERRCCGGHIHARTTGTRSDGGFFSTAHAKYQAPLCRAVARSISTWALRGCQDREARVEAWNREWQTFGLPLHHEAAAGPLRVYSDATGFQQ